MLRSLVESRRIRRPDKSPLLRSILGQRPLVVATASLPVGLALAYIPHALYRSVFTSRVGEWDNFEPRLNIHRAEEEEMSEHALAFMRRCIACHTNGLETFPAFAAAVLLAIITRVHPVTIDKLALSWVLSRIFYNFFYIYGTTPLFSTLRSLVWWFGLGLVYGLFIKSVKRLK
jgi:uncharacterized MAPEG superfamily protein